jgi:Tetratricopeptide repeat
MSSPLNRPSPQAEADRLYQSAGRHAAAGRAEEAKRDYLAALALRPTHFGALNDLGSLLYQTDFRTAARTCYAEAIKHHPDNPAGHINLANALLAEGETDAARGHYEIALGLAPDHPDALQGMANLLQSLGETQVAEAYRQRSYGARKIVLLPCLGPGTPCRVLVLVSAVGGNVPTRFLLDRDQFEVSILAVESRAAADPLPKHDLVFNAVGDADLCGPALDAAEAVLRRSVAPVINPPERIRPTGRAEMAERLAGLPGIITPRVVRARRDELRSSARAFQRPFLMRTPGFHTGQNFVRVGEADDVEALAAGLPGDDLLLIQYLDGRDAAGRSRKYRVMMVDGRLYPLHLAMSEDWKVHYFTADMAERPDHRAEEAAFLADMEAALGPRAVAGLAAIADRLALDYAGVDFGLSADGDVLLFEANATMVVNPPDPDPRWDYRRGPVEAILQATRAMIRTRAGV